MVLAICLLYAPVAGVLACSQQNSSSILIFCAIVRKCEPSRKSMSSDPLILRFVSNTLNAAEYALVCFSTRSYPMEIAFAQLFWAGSSESKYNLTLRGVGGRSRLDCVDEQVFCVSLARMCDWEMMQLFVGEPGSDLSVFQIVGEQLFSKDDLEEWARRAKQEQMALRAARLAQKITSTVRWWQRPSKSEKENRTQWAVSPNPQNPSCSAVKRRLSNLSTRKRQLPLRLMQCLPKAPSRPVQRRSEAIKAEAILEVLFSFPRLFELGGRLVGLPFATCIWTSMAQVTLVERNAFASVCAATHIRNGFSYGSDGYWPGWMMKLGRSTGHAFPPCSNGRQRHGGFRRRLNRGRAGHTA